MRFVMGEEAAGGDYLEFDPDTGQLVRLIGVKRAMAVAAEHLMPGDVVELDKLPHAHKVDK